MNQPDQLDDLFRQRLYHAETAPPAFVWPGVEAALRRKRRRFILWWCFAGLGLISTAATAFYLSQGTSPAAATPATELAPVVAQHNIQPTAIAATETASSFETANIPILPKTNKHSSLHKTAVATAVKENIAQPGQKNNTPSSIAKAGNKAPAISMLPEQAPTLLSHNQIIPPRPPVKAYHLPKKKKDKSCYDFEEHPNVWLVDAYLGPSILNQRLSTADPEYSSYISQRQSSEHTAIAFNGGVRASLLLNRHVLLRSGLHYTQLTQVFEHADPQYVEINIKVRQELINGVWQTFTDTISIDYGENYQKIYNRFGMLDIPLQAGVEWRSGRTGFSVQGGASLNLLFWKQGNMLAPDGTVQSFSPNTGNLEVFRPQLGASLMGSVQWFWHVSPRVRVFAEPYYRHILKSVTVDAYPLQQRMGFGGIQFGLTKILD